MDVEENKETRLGWQNGLLGCASIYKYIVASMSLDMTHPLLNFALSAQFHHGGEGEQRESRGGRKVPINTRH